ncbi:MAG: hypothetical protein HY364_02820 [Candidatus Aenigmarchaeota archaeon]|nr:hypothetical protein [Candidatus Aenigmarchaeota archaeon]
MDKADEPAVKLLFSEADACLQTKLGGAGKTEDHYRLWTINYPERCTAVFPKYFLKGGGR